MIILERQTGALVTSDRLRALCEALGRSKDCGTDGTYFAVYAPDLDDACSVIEQLANSLDSTEN